MTVRVKEALAVCVFVVLMAAGAHIRIPTPVFTVSLQLFVCTLSGLLLGARRGAITQIVYILIGLAGLPVFTYGGGPEYIVRQSFGFLLSFIAVAFVTGRLAERSGELTFRNAVLSAFSGLFVFYALGTVYIFFVKVLVLDSPVSIRGAAKMYSFPFLKDLVLLSVAAAVASRFAPALRRAGFLPAPPE